MNEEKDAIIEEQDKQTGAPTPEVTSEPLAAAGDLAAEEISAELDEEAESEDSLTFSNGVIEKIVALAVRDVPGVVGMKGGFVNSVQEVFGVRSQTKGVTVEVAPEGAVRVNIAVFIEYGAYAPQVFEDVKNAVVGAMNTMTGLEVAGVNLRVEDVLTEEEVAARRRSRGTQQAGPDALPEGSADQPALPDAVEPAAEEA